MVGRHKTRDLRKFIRNALGNGIALHRIAQQVNEQFGISKERARVLYHEEVAEIAATDAESRPYEKMRMLQKLERIEAIASKDSDWRTVLAVVDRMILLQGLDAPTKVEHSGPAWDSVGGMIDVEAARARVAAAVANDPELKAHVLAALNPNPASPPSHSDATADE